MKSIKAGYSACIVYDKPDPEAIKKVWIYGCIRQEYTEICIKLVVNKILWFLSYELKYKLTLI